MKIRNKIKVKLVEVVEGNKNVPVHFILFREKAHVVKQ